MDFIGMFLVMLVSGLAGALTVVDIVAIVALATGSGLAAALGLGAAAP